MKKTLAILNGRFSVIEAKAAAINSLVEVDLYMALTNNHFD